VGQKRQRPLGAQVRRFSPLRLLEQAMDALAGQDLRLRNKPVLGVVKEVGLVIEPPELQRPKAMAFNLELDGRRDRLSDFLVSGKFCVIDGGSYEQAYGTLTWRHWSARKSNC